MMPLGSANQTEARRTQGGSSPHPSVQTRPYPKILELWYPKLRMAPVKGQAFAV